MALQLFDQDNADIEASIRLQVFAASLALLDNVRAEYPSAAVAAFVVDTVAEQIPAEIWSAIARLRQHQPGHA